METEGKAEEPLSFMDQCRVLCLGYVSARGKLEIQSGKPADSSELGSLCSVAEQELAGFGEKQELQPFTDAASHLASTYEEAGMASERLEECLLKLQGSLDQEIFSESANMFIEPPIVSWGKVSQLLQLVFKACERHGTANVGTVIDISVRYMRNSLPDFVSSQGGWKSLAPQSDEEQLQSEISQSIVVVKQEAAKDTVDQADGDAQGGGDAAGETQGGAKEPESPSKDADESANSHDNTALSSPKNQTPLPLSPLDTPPFSIPSSVNTDDERDSLATPPEMIERPLMTESYIQAMGEEFRRVSNTSGTDFEMIGSDNGGTTDTQSATKSIEDAQASESPAETVDAEPEGELVKPPIVTGKSTPEVIETSEEPALGGYLPHISIGVAAAAAAVAGFFVLRKNM